MWGKWTRITQQNGVHALGIESLCLIYSTVWSPEHCQDQPWHKTQVLHLSTTGYDPNPPRLKKGQRDSLLVWPYVPHGRGSGSLPGITSPQDKSLEWQRMMSYKCTPTSTQNHKKQRNRKREWTQSVLGEQAELWMQFKCVGTEVPRFICHFWER